MELVRQALAVPGAELRLPGSGIPIGIAVGLTAAGLARAPREADRRANSHPRFDRIPTEEIRAAVRRLARRASDCRTSGGFERWLVRLNGEIVLGEFYANIRDVAIRIMTAPLSENRYDRPHSQPATGSAASTVDRSTICRSGLGTACAWWQAISSWPDRS